MKKVLLTVLAGVLAGMTFVPARAQDDADKKFEFNGEVRARYEYLNNYTDLTDTASLDANDDSFSIAPYRVMVGMTGNFAKNVTAHVDLQYVGAFGDEWNPSKDNFWYTNSPPPVGQGETAYQFATQGVQLYTGWLEMGKIGGSDFSARIGRQEHTYGTELFMGDNDYYSGLSFDGARGMWQHGGSDLSFFYYKIAEENCFETYLYGCFGLSGSNDSNLYGGTYDWKFKSWGTVGGYLLFGQDLGGDGPVFVPDSKVITFGARWNRGMMNGDKLNMFDWNIEYAVQGGDIGGPYGGPSTDLSAWIGEAWFAFNFKAGDTHGRVHIGTLMTSGDDLNTIDTDESFNSYYGDFHAYNRFGDLDWVDSFGEHNITDYNIGYEHWFGEAHYLMLAYHMFNETEDGGYGAPNKDLGDEIDLTYGFQYSKNLAFQVTLGQANPGDAAMAIYEYNLDDTVPGDPVQRGTIQAKLSW
jgi:hypothetical protein